MDDDVLTSRLALRRLTAADAEDLLCLDGDPEVMRYIDSKLKTLEQVRAEVLPRLAGGQACWPGFGYWAAETRAARQFIGWFGMRPVTPSAAAMVHWAKGGPEQPSVVELGYRLRRSVWGRGYATEGARVLITAAFADPRVREVVATTMAVNAGSRRVMEKAGLRLARTVVVDWDDPLDGSEHGEVEYRLLRDDWTATSCR
ncbi:MAG TPA: GNAT family N-acetyltransferase [Streptosporangiaceae bacterium]